MEFGCLRVCRLVARMTAVAALLVHGAGCSLVSLKSPEKPLSSRDLNARIVTREYSVHFIAGVEQIADRIAAQSNDPEVRLHALQWKIAAVGSSERAATQMAPMMGLLDSWALAVQMHAFLATGNGRGLFGAQQPLAVTLAAELAREAEEMARRVTPGEFDSERRFVEAYAQGDKLDSLGFYRGSIVDRWTRENGAQVRLVDSLGTVPEAMANVGDLMRLYGNAGPSQVLWQAQLAVQESGVSRQDIQGALQRFDDRLSRLSSMADATPGVVNGIVRDARTRFDATFADMMGTIRSEGATLTASMSSERAAATAALDVERAAVAADAARISEQVVRQAGAEVRRLVREALLLLIALAVVLLGLPFAAGYAVGRARGGSRPG